MEIKGEAQRVTIYIGESDKWQRKPLYLAILEMLREEDCAGATVIRALAGFGAHSRIKTTSLVALSADLPLIIEWIDNPERVKMVMPRLRQMVQEGLIIIDPVEVITYTHRHLRHLPSTMPVREIMQREVHTVHAQTPISAAADLLLGQVYKTLPVVDDQNRVVGLLTDGDLLRQANLPAVSARQALTTTELADALHDLRQLEQPISSVMTPQPFIIHEETSVADAIRLMLEHRIKRLPIVDDQDKLVGLISRVDVLRALSKSIVAEEPRRPVPPGQHTRVGEVMTTDLFTVKSDAPLAEIVERLVSNAQRRVIVVNDHRHVVGLITDGDLICRASATERPSVIQALFRRSQADALTLKQRTAAQVMTTPVFTVRPDTPLIEALNLLLEHRIKRLPVVDEQRKLVGLIGRGAILKALGQSSSPEVI
ncbi:MAG TPA: DUF190 domain-containing protein [Anaerolineae bacterium]|nr:DUF190 domain-containing protein [Anaerolineae bacterium]HMR63892.1 DUF190 domain-containing protein [Anaerolineae bacterium]